jgi:predicted dehydrogenase
LGLAGCGYEGDCLARAATRAPGVRLVACADPDATAATGVARLGEEVSTHSSVEEMLAEASVDAVLVATPNHLLCPVSLAALRAGKHVLVEKPIGLNRAEGTAIEAEAARAGVRCMAGYSCRFSLGRYVHELITNGAVGEIQAITGAFGCGPMDKGWVARPETGGGPLLYLGSHLVDMVLWFANDEVAEVSANIRRRPGTAIDATSTFEMRFSRGGTAQCLVTQDAPTFFFTIDVLGRSGRVTLRGWNFLQFEIEVASTTDALYAHPAVVRPPVTRDHITMMLVPELDEFARAVKEGRQPSVSATDGRRVLQVLDAVVEADHRRAAVALNVDH